jgi:hypothetical protein
MQCPTGNDCDIVFDEEENDSGDGVYFMSWTSYVYNPELSQHAPECPGLTEQQINQLEKERNEEGPDYSWMEP